MLESSVLYASKDAAHNRNHEFVRNKTGWPGGKRQGKLTSAWVPLVGIRVTALNGHEWYTATLHIGENRRTGGKKKN